MARPFASAPVQFAEPRAGASAFDVITVDNLSKRFGDFWALRGASFSIRRGEILGLIGPNGSGKTTLFQCFAGIAPATLGVVETRRASHPTIASVFFFSSPTAFARGRTSRSLGRCASSRACRRSTWGSVWLERERPAYRFSSMSARALPSESLNSQSHSSWSGIFAIRCGALVKCTPLLASSLCTPSMSSTK